jgi:hypothetical protein
MKETLKHIQETLEQIETLKQSTAEPSTITDRPISFQISPIAPKEDRLQLPQLFPEDSVDALPVGETKVERSPAGTPVERARAAQLFALEQVVQQIQALYYEGPIVDGWIDSFPTALESEDEGEEIVFERPNLSTEVSSESNASLSIASYRVCGLDEFGQQWSYACSVEQLLELSVAISRYRKIQELLAQKRQLEAQLEAQLKASAIGENNNKA